MLAAAAGHHARPLNLALLGFAAIGAYLLLVLARPTRPCPKCKGQRVIRRGKRIQRCTRCRATGRTYRLGATAVHRFYQSTASARRRERRRTTPDRPGHE